MRISATEVKAHTEVAHRAFLGQLVSLKLDSEKQPHIAFVRVTNMSPLRSVKYVEMTTK